MNDKKRKKMEELFDTLPELPKDLIKQCKEYKMPTPIFYRRKGKGAECRCGECGFEFEVNYHPERGIVTHCPICKEKSYFEWARCTKEKLSYFTVVLIQKTTDNNLVLRMIACKDSVMYGRGRIFSTHERNRIFLHLGNYFKYNNCNAYLTNAFWDTTNNGIMYMDYLYPGWKETIKDSNLKYFDHEKGMLVDELMAYAKNPAIEMLGKVGLHRLKDELVMNKGVSKYVNRRGKNLKEQLKLIDKSRINELIRMDATLLDLEVMQMEEKANVRLSEEERFRLKQLFVNYGARERLAALLRHMTIRQMLNRIEKYAWDLVKSSKYIKEPNSFIRSNVLTKYSDYIRMREELGHDMTNQVFVYPKDLEKKHQEVVDAINLIKDMEKKEKLEKDYPKVRERFEDLRKKYYYRKDGYFIIPADSASSIVDEGRTLHHCVGRSSYIKNHAEGRNFILFLRKEESENEPYYTIEIRDKEILQWYGNLDKKPDKEVIQEWLNGYIDHIGGLKHVS